VVRKKGKALQVRRGRKKKKKRKNSRTPSGREDLHSLWKGGQGRGKGGLDWGEKEKGEKGVPIVRKRCANLCFRHGIKQQGVPRRGMAASHSRKRERILSKKRGKEGSKGWGGENVATRSGEGERGKGGGGGNCSWHPQRKGSPSAASRLTKNREKHPHLKRGPHDLKNEAKKKKRGYHHKKKGGRSLQGTAPEKEESCASQEGKEKKRKKALEGGTCHPHLRTRTHERKRTAGDARAFQRREEEEKKEYTDPV